MLPFGVLDEGLPLIGAGGAEGVVDVAEDHVRLADELSAPASRRRANVASMSATWW